jgi:hypothetical protein
MLSRVNAVPNAWNGRYRESAIFSRRKGWLDSFGEQSVNGRARERQIYDQMAKAGLTREQAVAQLLVQLPTMGNQELRQLWRELFGREPSLGMRRGHMIPILAYRAQEKAFGGLKESTVRMLRELALGIASEAQAAYRPKTGTRYVREHNGKLHEVTVLDDGFEYQGKSYRSLTEIAKVITDTKWSGPAFFGLKRKKLAE